MSDFAEIADNGDEDGQNATIREPISPDGRAEPGTRYTVPARHGRAVRLDAGQRLKVINTHGIQVVDFWAFSAQNPAEFMSMEHLRAWIGRLIPRPGDELVTNRRRPIMVLEEDTSPGIHDTMVAACDLWRYRTLGVEGYHDNCADNLRMATKAIGLRVREVPSPFNLWMNIPVLANGGVGFYPTVSQPGDSVTLRAEMDCVAVMSCCPQDIVPINSNRPTEAHFEVL
jgi:hypothetical protein